MKSHMELITNSDKIFTWLLDRLAADEESRAELIADRDQILSRNSAEQTNLTNGTTNLRFTAARNRIIDLSACSLVCSFPGYFTRLLGRLSIYPSAHLLVHSLDCSFASPFARPLASMVIGSG